MSQTAEDLPNSSTISARPVQPDDEPFLLHIYASTRADELALVPWTIEQKQAFVSMQFAAQQDHYQKEYPGASHEIILASDLPIGRLYVAWLEDEIRIIDFTLLPEQRNAGVGSFLLTRLLKQAAGAGKVVRIYVEEFNPSLRLFERLGFKSVGEQGIYLLMEWNADRGATDE
jgi:ribosomal protein S18 acetylase RimI-like enzyme